MGFRYIGSKEKLSSIVISEIREINPTAKTVVDLMAGTGLFSLALREAGYLVRAADVMTYSVHHLNVHLFLDAPPEFLGVKERLNLQSEHNSLFSESNYEKIITYLNTLAPIKGYFYNEFSPQGTPTNTLRPRKYFSSKNAAKIDAIRAEIRKLFEQQIISEIEHSLLLHDLMMAANDIANIAGTYGHYLSKFTPRALDPILMRPSSIPKIGNNTGHTVYQGYAETIASQLSADFCYIDPPYMKRQYAANYHILETIAREDEPEAIGESGLRPWRDQYSNFCSKIKIKKSLQDVVSGIKCPDILISYSEDGLLPIDLLISILLPFGTVSKKTIKSNDSSKAPTLNEYLLHVHKL